MFWSRSRRQRRNGSRPSHWPASPTSPPDCCRPRRRQSPSTGTPAASPSNGAGFWDARAYHEVDYESIASVDVHDFSDEDGDAHRARLLVRNGEPIALTAVSRNRRAAEADRSVAAQALADL
jgi:hypothetical protein